MDQVQADKYLRAGYTIIAIDYRRAPQAKLPQILEDLADAHRWVRTVGPTLFRIDPNRIAVVGPSAGGYLALMTGFGLAPPPKAVVSFYGYGDITGAWYSRPNPFHHRQPSVSKEETYRAVGTRVIAEDPGMTRWPFYLYTRQHGELLVSILAVVLSGWLLSNSPWRGMRVAGIAFCLGLVVYFVCARGSSDGRASAPVPT